MSQLAVVPEESVQNSFGLPQQQAGNDADLQKYRPAPKRSTSSFTDRSLHRQSSIDIQMSAALRKKVPAEIPTPRVKQSHVWGWLDPSANSDLMPVTYLKGAGVALGRGVEAYEAQHDKKLCAAISAGRGSEHLPKMSVVEVADTRVSRLHCCIHLRASTEAGAAGQAVLEDHSSNGTYVNDERVQQGQAVGLQSGDKISLVRSVTPWVERCFTFWEGDPRDGRSTGDSDNGEGALFSPDARALAAMSPRRKLERTVTSDYTTAETSTLDDFQCQICLGTLRMCLVLEPCGHNWCATCLSNHFASLLQSGVPLACPLRCAPPERIVRNTAVRSIVTRLSPTPPEPPASSELAKTISRRSSSEQADADMEGMSAICPLDDEYLPIDAGSLKIKQLEICLRQLGDPASEAITILTALEALARLCWNDDEVRTQVSILYGIETVVKTMETWLEHEGVQCNCCLAIMALVRGTGHICQANQFRVAESKGVEAVVAAMQRFPHQTTVQLSALLCFIPLALENIMMQAHVSQVAMKGVLAALACHPTDDDIQAKGLVVLGVLGQGEDVMHDGIRQQQVEAGVPALIASSLKSYQRGQEEVLWAALFSLAVLIREGGQPYTLSMTAAVDSGLLPLLKVALQDHEAQHVSTDDDAGMIAMNEDADMIARAGNFLIEQLSKHETELQHLEMTLLRQGMCTLGVGAAAILLAAWAYWRRK